MKGQIIRGHTVVHVWHEMHETHHCAIIMCFAINGYSLLREIIPSLTTDKIAQTVSVVSETEALSELSELSSYTIIHSNIHLLVTSFVTYSTAKYIGKSNFSSNLNKLWIFYIIILII